MISNIEVAENDQRLSSIFWTLQLVLSKEKLGIWSLTMLVKTIPGVYKIGIYIRHVLYIDLKNNHTNFAILETAIVYDSHNQSRLAK